MFSRTESVGVAEGVDFAGLHREVRALRLALNIVLVSLLIFAGSIGVYLFRQVVLLRRQFATSSNLAQRMVEQFNRDLAPKAQVFEHQLREFAKTNPEFAAVMAKYSQSAPAPTAPVSTPGLPEISPPNPPNK